MQPGSYKGVMMSYYYDYSEDYTAEDKKPCSFDDAFETIKNNIVQQAAAWYSLSAEQVSFELRYPFGNHPRNGEIVNKDQIRWLVDNEGWCQFGGIAKDKPDGQFRFGSISTEQYYLQERKNMQTQMESRCQDAADQSGNICYIWSGGGLHAEAVPNMPYVKYGKLWHEVESKQIGEEIFITTKCGKSYNGQKCKFANSPALTKSISECKKCKPKK